MPDVTEEKNTMQVAAGSKIGLAAGWGRYPILVANRLKLQGYRVYCLGIKDHADPVLRTLCDDYQEVGLAKLGAAIRYFRRNDVRLATAAGKIHKVRLFKKFAWIKHLPDWETFRTFFPHYVTKTKDRKDDSMLGAILDAFKRHGITFAPATDYAPELLVKFGLLAGRRLTRSQRKDIEFGWKIAKELGRLDVGQSAVVKGLAVLAAEAVEGTDECIRRAGNLCTAGGFTVVKVAKPQQDMRFDVPTIGMGTIQTLAAAGGTVLAVEADKTIFVDQEEVVEFANRHHLTIVAIDPSRIDELSDA